jgi:hypothetical protein
MNQITKFKTAGGELSLGVTPLREDYLNYIFTYLSGAFGSQFTSKWEGTDPLAMKAVWGEMLHNFSDQPDAIKLALRDAAELQFPPGAGEFLALCRKRYHRDDADRPNPNALPDSRTPEQKEADVARAKQWIREAFGAKV